MTPIPHVLEPENINRRIVRATCSCGWKASSGRVKAYMVVADHDFHVWLEEQTLAGRALT